MFIAMFIAITIYIYCFIYWDNRFKDPFCIYLLSKTESFEPFGSFSSSESSRTFRISVEGIGRYWIAYVAAALWRCRRGMIREIRLVQMIRMLRMDRMKHMKLSISK